jgi:hypothetical protein
MRVGRDHAASTVNTLVLAYAGASLPLLLFFAQGDQPVDRLLTRELLAVEIVRMLVGSIGLVASVPITTGLAAVVLADDEVVAAPGRPGHDRGRKSRHDPTPALGTPRVGTGSGAPQSGWDGFSPSNDFWTR